MSDQENNGPAPTELDMLKQRAKMMGLVFSNNIGIETLRAKVQARMDGQPDPGLGDDGQASEQVANQPNPFEIGSKDGTVFAEPEKPETVQQMRERLIREQTRLIRCRIANLDPKKADLPGEFITVGNEYIGTITKFVPFGEVSDNGYHLPYIIYAELEGRKFQNIRTSKKAGKIHVETSWAKEFSLDVLDPLTPDEIARLAAAQAAGNHID